jgi:hypothetical protein
MNPYIHHTNAFMVVYMVFYDGPILYNKNDFIDFEWLFPKQIKKLINQGAPAKSDIKIVLEHFLTELCHRK